MPGVDLARRYGLLSGGLALAGFVALNVVPFAGEFVAVALLAWVGAWVGAGYVASVAHRLARWAAIGDDPGVDRHDGDLPAYETTADGRWVTVGATRHGRLRPGFDLVSETTLRGDTAGSGGERPVVLAVGRDGVSVVQGKAGRVDGVVAAASALSGRGRLVVEGEAVRFESEGLLDDAAELRERATALAGVATAVEKRESVDERRQATG